jgi:hypothetical protein
MGLPRRRGAASPSGCSRMSAQLRSWAQALCGDVSGNGVICPGPGHSARDRSLSVMPFAAAPNGFLVNSFAGDDPLVCLDYVRSKLGLPEFSPARPPRQSERRQSGAYGRYQAIGLFARQTQTTQSRDCRSAAAGIGSQEHASSPRTRRWSKLRNARPWRRAVSRGPAWIIRLMATEPYERFETASRHLSFL